MSKFDKEQRDTIKTTTGTVERCGSINDAARSLYNSITKASVVDPGFIHFNEEDPPPKEFISTLIPSLDKMLGGGIPIGKIGEIFGRESSGKSTLGYHLGLAVQKAGGYVLSIDTEHSWDTDRFIQIGGDPGSLIAVEADTVEQVFSLLISALQNQSKMIEKNGDNASPCLIIVDTVAAAPLAAEMAAILNGRDFQDMGKKAKFLSTQLRQFPRLLGATRAAIVFINQVRMKMNVMAFADPWDVPGGAAIKFYATWRIKVSNSGQIKTSGKEAPIGQIVKLKTEKCKCAPPKQQINLDLLYQTGAFDQLASVIEELKEHKYMRKSKGAYKMSSDLVSLGLSEIYNDDVSMRDALSNHIVDIQHLLGSTEKLEDEDASFSPDNSEEEVDDESKEK